MTWIDLPDDQATPELTRLTKRYRDAGTPTPSVIGIMKHAPKAMRGVLQLNTAVTFGASSLGRHREELIATATSAWNDCFY